jgi:phosphate transport system protein
MPALLDKEIDKLRKQIMTLSSLVAENLDRALKAVHHRNAPLAVEVMESDASIDQLEMELEEECLKILALHHPSADDLRYVIAVLKINNDLERIGDLAANIAEQAKSLAGFDKTESPPRLAEMGRMTCSMLRRSLESLVNLDSSLARKVCAEDDGVDAIHRETYAWVEKAIARHPDQLGQIIQFLSISRYLERVADHATNIAEDAIYTADGQIARHGRMKPPETAEDTIAIHDLAIHLGRREALLKGQPVRLAFLEFSILRLLAGRPGWVFSRHQIIDSIRGEGYPVTDRSVDVQIAGLRRKLGEKADYIETVRGSGYCFREK